MIERGFRLVTGGTDNHLLLVDLTPDGKGRGVFMQEALDAVGITVNKNTIPREPSSAFYPSGIRLGTPAATTRGMREAEMAQMATWLAEVRKEALEFQLPDDREARNQVLRQFRGWIKENRRLSAIHNDVRALCRRFPVPGIE
jgi:glycine hydroxymethyltransferase